MRYGGDVEEMPCQDGQQTHAHARGCGGLTCLAALCDAAETTYSSAGAARPRGRRRAPGDPPLECQMLHSPHTPVASWEAARTVVHIACVRDRTHVVAACTVYRTHVVAACTVYRTHVVAACDAMPLACACDASPPTLLPPRDGMMPP